MKKLFLPFLFLFTIISFNKLAAQTGIAINTDGSAADGSAMLDVKATDKGILIPRVALTSAVITPVNGLLVYQTGAPAGFYYYNGSAWVYIQNSGNANITIQGNTFNSASQLVQLNASTQLPAVDGSLLTNLNASNLASGTVNTARLGSGTASLSTFLRGDQAWASPPPQVMLQSLLSSNNTDFHIAVQGGVPAAINFAPEIFSEQIVSSAGTISNLNVRIIMSAAVAYQVTVTLYKNGVATLLSCITGTTVAAVLATTSGSDLVNTVSVSPGDTIGYVFTSNVASVNNKISIGVEFQK